MIRLVLVRLLVVVVSAAVVVSMQLRSDPRHARPPHVFPPVSAGLPGPPSEVNAAEVAAWIEGQQRGEWIAAELARLAEAARLEAEEQARAVAVRPSVPRPATTVDRGACAGLVLPEYIAWRESNCTRGIDTGNGYYGYGQVAAFHWFGGICTGLSWLVPDQEDECIRRLIAARGLAPWGG